MKENVIDAYLKWGVDVFEAIKELEKIELSIQCWQGDDVKGFENHQVKSSGGILATGSYPGRARNGHELRSDLEMALKYIPGKHRVNLHASYAESDQPIERDEIEPSHYNNWVSWAQKMNIGLDFNPTFFSHPLSNDFTLSHPDKGIREFWIEHGKRSRKIAEYIGKNLDNTCLNNLWIPDGFKDTPANRYEPRKRLKESLDLIFEEEYDPIYMVDSLESKVFGIGLESFTVGSSEFYLNYCLKNNIIPLLDMGHYHPQEYVHDKISALLPFFEEIALHISRPVRWDSDHVITFDDNLIELCKEVVSSNSLDKIHVGMDFFDASINRIAAWIIGSRNTLKGFLYALLLPHKKLLELQNEMRYTEILIILEEFKTYPFNEVWEYYCRKNNMPYDESWWFEVKEYERKIVQERK